MVKDKRYKTVKVLIETGNVTDFKDIFEHIPKTIVSSELGIHFTRMNKIVDNVNEIKIGDLFLLSGYFEIESKILFDLIYNQKNNKKAGKRK